MGVFVGVCVETRILTQPWSQDGCTQVEQDGNTGLSKLEKREMFEREMEQKTLKTDKQRKIETYGRPKYHRTARPYSKSLLHVGREIEYRQSSASRIVKEYALMSALDSQYTCLVLWCTSMVGNERKSNGRRLSGRPVCSHPTMHSTKTFVIFLTRKEEEQRKQTMGKTCLELKEKLPA